MSRYRCLIGQHAWELKDKTQFQPAMNKVEIEMASQETAQRLLLGYVVLTFICSVCGERDIQERP